MQQRGRALEIELLRENGAMAGVIFSRTEVADGQVRIVQDAAESARAPMTISSIGSIPEPIPGIPQKGETYTYVDQKIGLLMDGTTAVFAAGKRCECTKPETFPWSEERTSGMWQSMQLLGFKG